VLFGPHLIRIFQENSGIVSKFFIPKSEFRHRNGNSELEIETEILISQSKHQNFNDLKPIGTILSEFRFRRKLKRSFVETLTGTSSFLTLVSTNYDLFSILTKSTVPAELGMYRYCIRLSVAKLEACSGPRRRNKQRRSWKQTEEKCISVLVYIDMLRRADVVIGCAAALVSSDWRA
jgi:hypothetical protein